MLLLTDGVAAAVDNLTESAGAFPMDWVCADGGSAMKGVVSLINQRSKEGDLCIHLTCWPHLYRGEAQNRGSLLNTTHLEFALLCLSLLHLAVTTPMYSELLELFGKTMNAKGDNPNMWFKRIQKSTFNVSFFHIGASPSGCQANQNPLEGTSRPLFLPGILF